MTPFSPWQKAWRTGTVWFSLLVMLIFCLVAVLAPWISPHDPIEWRITRTNLPPMWVQDGKSVGTPEFPLGTDRYGRDIASRLIYGARTAMSLAFTAVPLAALIGTIVGLLAGYAGGKVDSFIMFLTDVIQSLPGIMFVVIIILILRNMLHPTWLEGLLTLVVGFAAISWVGLARLLRVGVMQVKSQLFVEAAVSVGAPPRRVITRHLLPNVLHVVLVWIINNIPAVILLEAVLGYLGVGVTTAIDGSEFTAISWGGMFFSGRSNLTTNPLMLVIPSAGILLLSMSFVLLADFLNGMTQQPAGQR